LQVEVTGSNTPSPLPPLLLLLLICCCCALQAGYLSFWSLGNVTNIDAAHPPMISFYKYVGKKGAATAEQTQTVIEGAPLVFSEPITFQGGDPAVATDDLAAIVLDDRNLASLASTTPALALQIGSDADGSWRLCCYGGDGDAAATSFTIEARIGGVWVTKTALTAE
jgi:hypothetical protein